MKRYKNKKFCLVAVAALVAVAPILISIEQNEQARGVDACATEECKEAKKKAEEAESKASDSLDAAKQYAMKVQELAADITAQEEKIEQTEQKIDELRKEIEKTQANLMKKQEALAEMLVNVHFENDREPIKILASSNSISDLAEKASREETARQQVSTAAGAVRDAKDKLEQDEAEVEDLLEEQQDTKKSLISKKKEQNEIKLQYEADADKFAEEAQLAREKQRAEEAAYREAHPEAFSGGYYSSSDGYEFAGRCPQDQDMFVDPWSYYGCECVSYAAWAVSRYHHISISGWGNASNWAYMARVNGFTVDNNPAPMTVGQTGSGPYGHVFWVESVDADGINISEYNGTYQGAFSSRKIFFPAAYSYNYIHF